MPITVTLSQKEIERITNALAFQVRMGGGFGHMAHHNGSLTALESFNNKRLIQKLETHAEPNNKQQ